jgi:hypothetical protein
MVPKSVRGATAKRNGTRSFCRSTYSSRGEACFSRCRLTQSRSEASAHSTGSLGGCCISDGSVRRHIHHWAACWPYSTEAAIVPNKLYLIGGKESILSQLFGGNFLYPPEPALFRDRWTHHSPHLGRFRHELPGSNAKRETRIGLNVPY